MSQAQDRYDAQVRAELGIFKDWTNIHELPAIFHYWSNRYVRPKLEAFGFSSPVGMFKLYLERQCQREQSRPLRFISMGAGNCDLEVEFAAHLVASGHSHFVIECLDLNPAMLDRGRDAAREHGVSSQLCFVEGDFNRWRAEGEYDAVLAVQALHHVVNLEGLFREIRACLRPQGQFLISDIIGRRGHQRWPESLEIVQELWKELPPSHRYNRLLQRQEEAYINWDCSTEGFEGIRSQDILPLLLSHFHFQLFVAYGNVIDPFIDRAFGHNYDAESPSDREFIDRVHARDEAAMRAGIIKPVHMEAVLGKERPERVLCHPPLTPEFCVRWPDPAPYVDPQEVERLEGEVRRLDAESAALRDENSALLQTRSALSQELELAQEQMRMASDSRWLKLGRKIGIGPRFR